MDKIEKFPDPIVESNLCDLRNIRDKIQNIKTYGIQSYEVEQILNKGSIRDLLDSVSGIINLIDSTVSEVGELNKYVRDLHEAIHEKDPTKPTPEGLDCGDT